MTLVKTSFISLLLVSVSLFTANNANASSETEALKARIQSMEKELSDIKSLLRQQINTSATKAEVDAVKKEVQVSNNQQNERESFDSKVHLGGYGQVGFSDGNSTNSRFNQVQFSPIFHYQYRDDLLLEAELEMEVEENGETKIGLEYLTIDWLINDYMALVTGKFLSPLGQFRQNLHPSWINKLPSAPSGFGHDQAAPISDVGIQLRGGIPFGDSSHVNYAVFVSNGPELELNEDGDEIEAVESAGFTRDIDGNKLFGGRIGFLPIPNVEIGLSGSVGDIALEGESDRDYEVFGVDFYAQVAKLDIRGEYMKQEVASLSSSIAEEGQQWEAWYLQSSYKFFTTKFEAVARYSDFDSTHADQDQRQWAIGLNYLIAPNAQLKLAYEFNEGLADSSNDDDNLLLQMAFGF
jgi:hypothetical protein